MEPIKATLCPLCTECPEVVITDEGVTIGDANSVRLSHAEWNELVRLITRGELREVCGLGGTRNASREPPSRSGPRQKASAGLGPAPASSV